MKPTKRISSTHYNAFCKIVIRHAAIDKILKLRRRWEREVSLDYLMNEKFVQFAEPEQLEEYLFTACGQTAVLYHAELAAALALLPEQAQEEIFRYYFLRQPQRVIGVHIGRTRSTAGRHIQLALKRQVLDLLNSLIISPEQLRFPATAPPDQSTERSLQRELDRVMECQPIDEDAAKSLILSIAAAQYSAVDSREYETVRLRRVFSGRQSTTALDAELLQRSVSAIHCHNDGSLNIQLKNGQVIGKE